MRKSVGLFFGIYFSCIASVFAKADITEKHGALFVEKATYAEVENLFEKYDYVDFDMPGLPVPRIYLKTLPTDWEKIEKGDDKNRLFIRILLPLIMKINEELSLERSSVESLSDKLRSGKQLSEKEKKLVEEKAEKYDIFSRNKDENRYKILLAELSERVDELPPGLLIALAGIYSDWGNSRLAIQANSLYREEVWYSDEGIEPENVKNAEFRYRKFSSLEDGLKSYMHQLNTQKSYKFVRVARTQSRKIGRKVLGEQIMIVMSYDGKLKNIAGMLDFNLSYYKLNKTDMFPFLANVEMFDIKESGDK